MKPIQYPVPPAPSPTYSVELTANPRLWGPYFTHDPSLLYDEENGLYYVYSTDMGVRQGVAPGIQIRRSKDLITWEFIGQALPGGIDSFVEAKTQAVNLWTPDVIRYKGYYRLYYAATTFGSQVSLILMAVSEKPEGPFYDSRVVLESHEGDPVNAISPSIFIDPSNDRMYMVYGSYWEGIYLLELDPETGAPLEKGFGTRIACRSSVTHGSVEGACLRYRNGYYYLFVSSGSLAFDYHVRVARSKKISGPYVDYNGIEQTDLEASPAWVGTIVVAPYRFGTDKGWKATGAASVLQVGNDWYFAHHARPEGNQNYTLLHLRKMVWTVDDWPTVSPERYTGEKMQEIPVTSIFGHYERVALQPMLPQSASASVPIIFRPDGSLRSGCLLGSWRRPDECRVHVSVAGREEELIILPAWDYQEHRQTLVMTGLDSRGVPIWYKKSE